MPRASKNFAASWWTKDCSRSCATRAARTSPPPAASWRSSNRPLRLSALPRSRRWFRRRPRSFGFANPDHRHQPARARAFAAVAEEQIGAAARAQRAHGDVFGRDAGVDEAASDWRRAGPASRAPVRAGVPAASWSARAASAGCSPSACGSNGPSNHSAAAENCEANACATSGPTS